MQTTGEALRVICTYIRSGMRVQVGALAALLHFRAIQKVLDRYKHYCIVITYHSLQIRSNLKNTSIMSKSCFDSSCRIFLYMYMYFMQQNTRGSHLVVVSGVLKIALVCTTMMSMNNDVTSTHLHRVRRRTRMSLKRTGCKRRRPCTVNEGSSPCEQSFLLQ